MKFTSSVEKIWYKWALYGCKTLKTSQRVRNVQVSLDLSVISDSVEEQTDFSCFLSTVVLLNRPRSHGSRSWKLDRSEIGLAGNFFFWLKWILETPDHLRDPDLLLTKPKARSGQIRLLPVRNVTGDERAHVRNKSSIFDVLSNEFDRTVKFFSKKTWLYAHLKYEATKCLLFWFFLTSNSTRQLVWISLSLRALKPQSSTRQLLRENFIPSSKIFIDTETEF